MDTTSRHGHEAMPAAASAARAIEPDDIFSRQLPDRMLSQLDTDRRDRYSASSPMPRLYTWWMQRLTATLLLTAMLPVVCWWLKEFERAHSHHGHGDEHGAGHGDAHDTAHNEVHDVAHADSHDAAHGDVHDVAHVEAHDAAHGEVHEVAHMEVHEAPHVDEHGTAAHAEPAAAYHRALQSHNRALLSRRLTVECHDDPEWTSHDGKSKCVDYEDFFTQYDCEQDAFAADLTAHCPVACGFCDHWIEKQANAAVATAETAAGHVKTHALRFIEAQAQLCIILVLVVVTLLFEWSKDLIEERFHSYRPVLERVWGELTVLGFLALCTFLMIQSEVLQYFSKLAFGDEEHMVHMFEKIHFALFFVLVVFLIWALWILWCAVRREEILDNYETQIIFYGRLARARDGAAQAPPLSMVDDYGYLVCQEELKHASEQLALQSGATAADVWPKQEPQLFYGHGSRSANYVSIEEGKLKRVPMDERIPPKPADAPPQPSGPERLRKPSFGAWVRSFWLLLEAKQRARFQMLRHRFLLADGTPTGGKGGRDMLPADFQFSNYQQECATAFMEHTLHLGTQTWLISLLVMAIIIEGAEELSPYTIFNEPVALWLFILLGWAVLICAMFVEDHYQQILDMLLPVGPIKHHTSHQALVDALAERGPMARFRAIKPVPNFEALGEERELPTIKELTQSGAVQVLAPGDWKIQPVQKGVGRQLALFKLKMAAHGHGKAHGGGGGHGAGHGGGHGDAHGRDHASAPPRGSVRHSGSVHGDAKHGKGTHAHEETVGADQRHAAVHAAQLFIQAMLLFSALYLTIIVVFIPPSTDNWILTLHLPEWWDPHVALGVFPVLMLMIMVVPDCLAPMIYALSIEEFSDSVSAKKVLQHMKLAKFAQAAKLMQGMRSRRRAHKKREAAAEGEHGMANLLSMSADDFVRTLPEEKRKRGIELKRIFEAFEGGPSGKADGLLDLSELGMLMKSLGSQLTQAELEQLIEELDVNGDGQVSFVEFAQHMLEDDTEEPTEAVAEAIFDMMDTDGSGNLTMHEIKSAFETLNTGLTDEDVAEIVSRMDADDSGEVDREEFVKLITQILEGNL